MLSQLNRNILHWVLLSNRGSGLCCTAKLMIQRRVRPCVVLGLGMPNQGIGRKTGMDGCDHNCCQCYMDRGVPVKISQLFLIFYLQYAQPAIFKANFSYAFFWNYKFLHERSKNLNKTILKSLYNNYLHTNVLKYILSRICQSRKKLVFKIFRFSSDKFFFISLT